MRKAQAAMEFALILSALLVFFAIFMVVLTNRTAERVEEDLQMNLQNFATILTDEIDTAFYVEDGYTREFNLPATVGGYGYDLGYTDEVDGKFISINITDADVEHGFLVTKQFSGEFIIGDNIIQKMGGEVLLNPPN